MSSIVKENRAILLHENDNVATALEDLTRHAQLKLGANPNEIPLLQDIQFGHKFAIQTIQKGEIVKKYGVSIGMATKKIQPGEHVHLHNLMSLQMKGDPHEGLQKGGWKNRNT